MTQLTALAADVFAGGFSLGVQRYFRVLAHFEENSYGVATARRNFPKMPIHVGFDKWPLDEYRGKVNFVFANPPCAAWSVAGYTKTRGTDKWRTDPRVDCSRKCFSLLKELHPEVYATESVTQAWTKGREFFEELMKEAADDGYSCTVLLHDAQWLGLPQVRKRVFFVFHRVAFNPVAPNWQPAPTPLQALEGVTPGEPRYEGNAKKWPAKLLRRVKPGERLAKFWEREIAGPEPWPRNARGKIAGRPSFGHYRLPKDRPGGAIVGYSIIHPTEPRWISTEEMQALNGFPESYHFIPNSPGARASEIARGVCPPVAEWLARSVKASIEQGRAVTSPEFRVVDYRRPPADADDRRVHEFQLGEPIAAAKQAVTVKRAAAKPPPPVQLDLVNALRMPKPKAGVRSGLFIKLLLDMEKWTTAEIVQAVRSNYPESKATGVDVSYHRDEMRRGGRLVGVVKQTAAGRRLVPYEKKVRADG